MRTAHVVVVVLIGVLAIQGFCDEPSESPIAKKFIDSKAKQTELEMVVRFPPGWKETDRRPGIVFFFGGGWENGTIQAFEPQAKYFASRGMVAARADYRVKSRQGVTPKNTRGRVELIVRNVGLDMGVIAPTLFAMMVVMALATTLATGPVLSALRMDQVEKPSDRIPSAA
jgi:hypothetical protein